MQRSIRFRCCLQWLFVRCVQLPQKWRQRQWIFMDVESIKPLLHYTKLKTTFHLGHTRSHSPFLSLTLTHASTLTHTLSHMRSLSPRPLPSEHTLFLIFIQSLILFDKHALKLSHFLSLSLPSSAHK